MYIVSLWKNNREHKRTFHDIRAARLYMDQFWHLSPLLMDEKESVILNDWDNVDYSEY